MTREETEYWTKFRQLVDQLQIGTNLSRSYLYVAEFLEAWEVVNNTLEQVENLFLALGDPPKSTQKSPWNRD